MRISAKLFSKASLAALLFPAASFAAVPENLTGTIKVDGSSTVFPITEAVAEEFGAENSKVKITVGISGTGGGFTKFCAGEIDISDASRPIKATEIELCAKNNVEYIELPVAYDALSVIVNPKNTWATTMTVKELKKIWEPEAQEKITTWNQIRPDWPNQPIKLFGAGVDSGTYDYFTEAIVGKEHSSRGDFTSSEDDNVVVQGVSKELNSLGFFGMSYFAANKNLLKAVAIDDENDANGKGPQEPTAENVIAGIYQPLSRPLFIYVRKEAAEKPEIKAFVDFYLKSAKSLVTEVGYVPLPDKVYTLATDRFQQKATGTVFEGKATQVSLEELLSKPAAEKKS